ncbi:hypothetical protein BH24BAC1_BH24BAC1_32990 [soil metagenome]
MLIAIIVTVALIFGLSAYISGTFMTNRAQLQPVPVRNNPTRF